MADSTVLRAFDVQVNAHKGSTILVRGREVYELQEIEGLIWSLCDGGHTIAQISTVIAAQYDVDEATASADVQEFVDELVDQKLAELITA